MEKLDRKVRSKKLGTRVDLTAMVSISFLLIIFFMVVGELSKPKIMALGLPDKDPSTCGGWRGCGGENRSLTILLGGNNKLVSYMGILEVPIVAPREMNYGTHGIRQELQTRNNSMLKYSSEIGKSRRGITVIIKPSKKCNFKNLVDILDEMAIANIQTYTIINDFTPEESKLLASK